MSPVHREMADVEVSLVAGFERNRVPRPQTDGRRRLREALDVQWRSADELGEAIAHGVLVHHAGHRGQDAVRLRPPVEGGAVGGSEREQALDAAVDGATAWVR